MHVMYPMFSKRSWSDGAFEWLTDVGDAGDTWLI